MIQPGLGVILRAVHDLAVHKRHPRLAADRRKRVRRPEDEVRILARFKTADTRVDAEAAGRVDGDGVPRLLHRQTGRSRQSGRQRQILQRNDRRIRDDADRQARAVQRARRREALVAQLDLRLAAERRSDEDRDLLLCQLIGDQLAVRTVVQRELQAKLARDAHGRQDIIRAVGVALERDLAVDHGQHGLELHVERRILARRLVVAVAERAQQQLAQQGGDRHARHGALALVVAVAALGILAKGALHRGGRAQNHPVDALSCQLYDGERAADDVCAAGSGAGRRHAAAQGQPEGLVLRIDGVDGAQLRRQRLDDLIIIHALPAHALVVEADMAVGIDKAGGDDASGGVDDRCALGGGEACSDLFDLAVLDQDVTTFQIGTCHGLDMTVLNKNYHVNFLLPG